MTSCARLSLLVFTLLLSAASDATAQAATITATVSGPTISLTWAEVSGATSYVVDGGLTPGTYLTGAAGLAATPTGFSVAAPGIGTYYLRMRAFNGATLLATSNEVAVTVSAMVSTPTSVEAFSYCGGVLVRWQSGGGTPTGYRVSVTGAYVGSFTTTSTQFYAPAAPAGSYSFSVQALSGVQASTASDPVPVTVGGTATVPTPVVSSSVYGQFVQARWTPVPGATSYALVATQNGTTVLGQTVPATVTSIRANGVGYASYAVRVTANVTCGAQSAAGETTFVVDGAPPSGPRTPNPAPGQRLSLPSYGGSVVRQLALDRPDLLYASCAEHGGNNRFMFEAVRRLRQQDTRWGLNWKRGNFGDLSQDIVTYNFGSEPDEGTRNVYIIDIIGGHCGPSPSWNWQDQTGATVAAGSIGVWTLLPYIDAGFTP